MRLGAQRSSVRSIVEGLDEETWHTPVVASGWTVAGMVEHLSKAERHWFVEASGYAKRPIVPGQAGDVGRNDSGGASDLVAGGREATVNLTRSGVGPGTSTMPIRMTW
ncbi:MAG: DUF664 domain-containing protein [Xanthobacteraceae bacterium]